MYILYGIGAFILSSSSLMVGYVWVRDIKNTREQRLADILNQENEDKQLSDEVQAEYPHLIKKTA